MKMKFHKAVSGEQRTHAAQAEKNRAEKEFYYSLPDNMHG